MFDQELDLWIQEDVVVTEIDPEPFTYFSKLKVEDKPSGQLIGYIGETSNYWVGEPALESDRPNACDSKQECLDWLIDEFLQG